MKTKRYYSTHYDDYHNICGYVMAEEHEDHLTITRSQYSRALHNLTIGGDAGVCWHTDKPVRII